jgi:hypothetical protein
MPFKSPPAPKQIRPRATCSLFFELLVVAVMVAMKFFSLRGADGQDLKRMRIGCGEMRVS